MFPTNLNVLGLSAETIEARQSVVGGSDARIIMGDDQKAITDLWKQKRGDIEPPNMDDVMMVMLGHWTEPFNRLWFEKMTGTKVIATPNALEMRFHRNNDFMACNTDGLVNIAGEPGIFEAKHMFALATDDDAIAKYYPQMQHNIEVCHVDYGILSIIFGNNRYQHYRVERDVKYVMEMVKREENFMASVRSGKQPTVYGEAPVAKIAVDKLAIRDMSKDNEYVNAAVAWLELAPKIEVFKEHEKTLKAACDHEHRIAFADVNHPTLNNAGKAVKVTVAVVKNAAGSLSLREANKADAKKIAEWKADEAAKPKDPKPETAPPAAPVAAKPKSKVRDDDL